MNRNARTQYNRIIQRILPMRCVLNAGKCSFRSDKNRRKLLIQKQPYAFIIRPYSNDCKDMEDACKGLISINYFIALNNVINEKLKLSSSYHETPDNAGQKPLSPKEMAAILAKDDTALCSGYCQICSLCLYSYFGVAELGHLNPNVLLEIGLMIAYAKPIIFTLDTRLTSLDEVPFDLNGLLLVIYQNNDELISGLDSKIKAVIAELKKQYLL